jgi:hypothetical protein
MAAAFMVAVAAFLPATSASADALNPLTDRSLTLSSSAPGWDYKDGSGNVTYAAPNSGANGQKTGNTFSFKVSTDSSATGTNVPVNAFTFQYCTQPAGTCTAPGNNLTTATTRGDDTADTSDLRVVENGSSEVVNATTPVFNTATGFATTIPDRDDSEGNYIVMTKDVGAGSWSQSTGWTMVAENDEDGQAVGDTPNVTGKENSIKLTKASGGLQLKTGGEVKIIFFGTDDNYITNPGEGAFFVKINNYTSTTVFDDTTLVDGGVTVANVMNLGISIQTKVLETMDFSVGTVDPYTLDSTGGASSQLGVASDGTRTTHGVCDPILNAMDPDDPNTSANTLLLGSEAGENSLETDHTYSTHSYFRLSSNASAGATVYYSGVTLSNTVGDQITAIGPNKIAPSPGSEQFGLALANGTLATGGPDHAINYETERLSGEVYENGADNAARGLVELNDGTPTGTGVDATVATDWTAAGISGKLPMLRVNNDGTALAPLANYDDGAGTVNGGGSYGAIDTAFAFDTASNLIPVAIAQESNRVVDCASAKVRYIANIAATTPAGIYTTKVNFIAAPQY